MYDYLHQSKKVISRKEFLKIHKGCETAVNQLKDCESQLIKALQQVDKYKVYRYLGLNSLFRYALSLKLSEAQAYNYITVARKSLECPQLLMAIENKEITISKARTISAVIEANSQNQWLELARTKSKRELEREVSKVSPRAIKKESTRFINDHTLELQLSISEDIFKQLERVKDLLSQKSKRNISLEEALQILSQDFLTKNDPVIKAQRMESVSLLKPVPGRASHSSADKASRPFRKRIPAAVVHRIHARDEGKCQFRLPDGTICGQSRWIDFHHIQPVSQGGQNDIDNLITLCSGHHKAVHDPGFLHRAKSIAIEYAF